jgi:hypothetical protein
MFGINLLQLSLGYKAAYTIFKWNQNNNYWYNADGFFIRPNLFGLQ